MFKVVEKWGGGKLMIVKKGLNHIRWEPVLVMFLYLDAERYVVCKWRQRFPMGTSDSGTTNCTHIQILNGF